jgi:serine/threonine protein kinase
MGKQALPVEALLINRYRIIRQLTGGEMGFIYEAKDLRDNRIVALKEPRLTEDYTLQAFYKEADLLSELNHPGLPRFLNFFDEDNRHFLVMEFIEGDDFKIILEKNGFTPFSIEEVMEWSMQLLDTLEYLHAKPKPIIHRDLKPTNIKVTAKNKVILLDFGLSKTMDDGTIVAGYTRAYSSPEQIAGEGTDERSDLYSLGATLYYLLTGIRPPGAKTRKEATEQGKVDPLFSIHIKNPSVSRALSDALHAAMALKPEERPGTAQEMRQMLNYSYVTSKPKEQKIDENLVVKSEIRNCSKCHKALASKANFCPFCGEKTVLVKVPMQSVRKKFLQDEKGEGKQQHSNWKAPVWAGLLLLLSVLFFFISRNFPFSEEKQSPVFPDGRLKTEVPEREWQDNLLGHTGEVSFVTFRPDGINVISSDSNKGVIYWNTATRESTTEPSPSRLLSVAFSPDGKAWATARENSHVLMYKQGNGNVILYNLETNKIKREFRVLNVISIVFSPDNNMLLSVDKKGEVIFWDAYTGKRENSILLVEKIAVEKANAPMAEEAAQDPDSNEEIPSQELFESVKLNFSSVAFAINKNLLVSGHEDGFVRVWNLRDGSLYRKLEGHASNILSVACSSDGTKVASCGDDETIKVWNIQKPSKKALTFSNRITDSDQVVAFSLNGKMVASAGNDNKIKLWNTADGSLKKELRGNADSVLALAFSSDGKTLVSGSKDKTVKTWNISEWNR